MAAKVLRKTMKKDGSLSGRRRARFQGEMERRLLVSLGFSPRFAESRIARRSGHGEKVGFQSSCSTHIGRWSCCIVADSGMARKDKAVEQMIVPSSRIF